MYIYICKIYLYIHVCKYAYSLKYSGSTGMGGGATGIGANPSMWGMHAWRPGGAVVAQEAEVSLPPPEPISEMKGYSRVSNRKHSFHFC